MTSLVKGALGLLPLGAVAGAGVGISYLYSKPVEKNVVLPDNLRWLGEEDVDIGEWWEKASEYEKGVGVRLDNYTPESEVRKKGLNITKMKKACKLIKEGKFEDSEGKLEQAKSWCSVKKKIRDVFDSSRWLSFAPLEVPDSEWNEKFEKNLKENNSFNVSPWNSSSSDSSKKVEDIQAMKRKCQNLMLGDIEDGGTNVALFEAWCTK